MFLNDLSSIPTVRQARGKIIVFRPSGVSSFKKGCTWGSGRFLDIQDDYQIGRNSISFSQKERRISDYIHRAQYRQSPKITLNHVSAVAEGTIGGIFVNPISLAKRLNVWAYKALGSHNGKRSVGVIIMDFPGEKLLYRIISKNFVKRRTCTAKTYRTQSGGTYALFMMPRAKAGTVISIRAGAYAIHARWWTCHRATWTNLRFKCDNSGVWTVASGSWDADGYCRTYNTHQRYLRVGRR